MDCNVINSEEPETLPNTQPLNFDSECGESWSGNSPWAHLVSVNYFLPSVNLVKPKFVCGRQRRPEDSETQFLTLEANGQIPESFSGVISRQHFAIERDSDGDVFIVDFSTNGTFVNSVLVGKGQSHPLVNNDTISFAATGLEGFKFVQADTGDAVRELPDIVKQKYVIGKLLGTGISGCVYTAFPIDARNQKFALKIIKKTTEEVLSHEVDVLRKLKHPNIIRLHDVIEDENHFVIVMELARGGELFGYVLEDYEKKTFNEEVAKLQFYQILQGVAYMHSQNVCHRDLKLENIFLAGKGRTSLIKIGDFGLSKVIGFGTRMTSFVGTSNYIAPEVLKNGIQSGDPTSYGLNADMWSCGCILYSLLCGSPAFHAKNNNQDLNSKILTGSFNMSHPGLAKMSYEAKDLIAKLLRVDPMQRLTARAALAHPWLDDRAMIKRARELSGPLQPPVLSEVQQISRGVRMLTIQSPTTPRAQQRQKRRSHIFNDDENEAHGCSDAPPTKRNAR